MKVQIRRHAFETNSSTQHTVTICKDGTDFTRYVGKTIILGENVSEDLFWDDKFKKDPIAKLNMLWAALSHQRIGNFLGDIYKIKTALADIGIGIEITMNPEAYSEWEYCGEGLDDMSNHILDSNEHIINFIFNPNSWYDCYEDDCCYECPYEKDIKKDNETFWYRGS